MLHIYFQCSSLCVSVPKLNEIIVNFIKANKRKKIQIQVILWLCVKGTFKGIIKNNFFILLKFRSSLFRQENRGKGRKLFTKNKTAWR